MPMLQKKEQPWLYPMLLTRNSLRDSACQATSTGDTLRPSQEDGMHFRAIPPVFHSRFSLLLRLSKILLYDELHETAAHSLVVTPMRNAALDIVGTGKIHENDAQRCSFRNLALA